MNYKPLAIITVLLLVSVMLCPRPIENKFHVESIIDYGKGINAHYPKTGNEKLDRDIYAYISKVIREYEETVSHDALLNISFDCYSSLFTVIRFTVTNEREHSTRAAHLKKVKYKFFFTFTRGDDSDYEDISESASVTVDGTPYITEKKLVALTFDDGPSEHTINILNTLDSYGVKATFCVLGTMVSSHRSTIELMHSGGHEIANHTYNHKRLTSLDEDEMLKEVQRTQEAVYEITGEYPAFLRPTYGAINSKVRTNIPMPLLMWNTDTMDWNSRNPDYIFSQAINNLDDGDIILFHDIYPSTVQAIEKLIPYLLDNGYYPVTASELLTLRGIEPAGGKAYFSSGDST